MGRIYMCFCIASRHLAVRCIFGSHHNNLSLVSAALLQWSLFYMQANENNNNNIEK